MDPMGEIEIKLEITSCGAKPQSKQLDTAHDSPYSQSYLDQLANKAAPAWQDVADSDAWLDEIRGRPCA